jgi:2-polyprenyl-6-hydroxyphenyl methylase/3-demethylubiquinone-9 3-methyltransferase
MGDYHRFATELVWELGPVVVEAAGIRPGMRVLDVAAGTGNVAIRAAQAGAIVVASDITPENFEAGKHHARDVGVTLDWVEADAQALPFSDDEFDVVTSSVGALFAPDHQRVADEMIRVCRPGGKVAMANFTPEGLAAEFFGVFAPYAPPPEPGAMDPVLWGSESHVRRLFGDRVSALDMTRKHYVERAATPRAYCDLFKQTFGPTVALYEAIAGDAERTAALDRDFLQFAIRSNRGPASGPAEYTYEYLLVVARVRTD